MKRTKAKTAVAEVKTPNPLKNGSFDEKAARDVLKFVKEKNIQIIDLKFNDLPGLWQHFSIPASELLEMDDITRSIWVDGIGFDACCCFRNAWPTQSPTGMSFRTTLGGRTLTVVG